jgi:hypothetical protein
MDNPGIKYLGDFVANFGMSEDVRRDCLRLLG